MALMEFRTILYMASVVLFSYQAMTSYKNERYFSASAYVLLVGVGLINLAKAVIT